jgi:hypothetical protein
MTMAPMSTALGATLPPSHTLPETQAQAHAPAAWQRLARRLATRVRTSWQAHKLYLAESDEAIVLPAFAQWCAANEGAVCDVALPSRMLLCSVTPPSGSGRQARAQAREQALAQWAHYHDLTPEALAEQWVLRQLVQPAFGLLCAAPRSLIAGLVSAAAEHGVRLRWVGPWWVAGLQTWLSTLQADQPEPLHCLVLHEPGMRTHVQATQKRGERAALSLLWAEAADLPGQPGAGDRSDAVADAGSGSSPYVVSMQARDTLAATDVVSSTASSVIWAHDSLKPLLKGDASVWQAPA